MFSLANFQVVHLVTSEFFQQGDLERTTLKMEPSVSTERGEDRGDFGDGHTAETRNWAKGCGKIRVCPFICPVTLLNSQLNLALVVKTLAIFPCSYTFDSKCYFKIYYNFFCRLSWIDKRLMNYLRFKYNSLKQQGFLSLR